MSSKDKNGVDSSQGMLDVSTGEYCPVCGDELFVRCVWGGLKIPLPCSCKKEKFAKEKREKEEREKFQKEYMIKELYKNSGMPPKELKETFENFIPRPGTENALKAAKRFAAKAPKVSKGILFMGTCGSGKTHLAAAIGKEVMNKGYSVKFITASDFYKNIRATFSENSTTEKDVIAPLIKCRLLIVDEIGATAPTAFSKSEFHNLIDMRLRYERPTILTTNLTTEELSQAFDSRTVDRFSEGFVNVIITADSYRRKGAG